MTSQSDWSISVPEHVSWTSSNGEVLVFNARTEEISGLDAVAADAFTLLVAHGRLSDAIDALRRVYAVDVETLQRDVASLVHQLEARGLVRVQGVFA